MNGNSLLSKFLSSSPKTKTVFLAVSGIVLYALIVTIASVINQPNDTILVGEKSLEEYIQEVIGKNSKSGEIGQTGKEGATGECGKMGATGETGATGECGKVGATGETGATGDPGDLSAYLTSQTAASIYQTLLPTVPLNPATKFLNGNKEWVTVSIGGGGYSANLYFTDQDSDISGYKVVSYTSQEDEVETSATISNTEVLARAYLFDYPVGISTYDAGIWIANYRCKVSKDTGDTYLRMEIFARHEDGSETILWSEYSPSIENQEYETIRSESNQPVFNILPTDRMGAKIYLKTTGHNITINTVVGGPHASYFTTPLRIRHNQLRDLNGDPAYQHIDASDRTLLTDIRNGTLHTNYLSPTDFLLVTGANKTLVLDTAVWDDLDINPGLLNLAGIADPLLVSYQPTGSGMATRLYEFETGDTAYFQAKLPHGYKTGSNIYAHIHWTPGRRGSEESSNTVGWKIGYAWSNVGEIFPSITTLNLSDSTDGTDDKHQITPSVPIAGFSKSMDSILIGYITRTDTGTDDTWSSTTTSELPLLLEIDFHYQKDTLGSREQNAK